MGDEAPPTLEVTPPLAVNTINRTVYWYSRNQAVLMQQSLNGGEPEVRTEHRECLLGTVKPRNSNWGSIFSAHLFGVQLKTCLVFHIHVIPLEYTVVNLHKNLAIAACCFGYSVPRVYFSE